MVDPRVGLAAADVLMPQKLHLLQMAGNLHNGNLLHKNCTTRALLGERCAIANAHLLSLIAGNLW
jgi:hypothetical protein